MYGIWGGGLQTKR